MKKKNSTKKALLTSVLSLLLCASMLVGTTFAWFTDSVSTGVNTIASGNLDVDVFYGDPALKQSIEGIDTLFNDVKLWEPGAVAYENLTVANLGSLALKYEMSVSFANENYILENGQPTYSLPEILQVGISEGYLADGLTREQVLAEVDTWIPMQDFLVKNNLSANTNEMTMGLVIWWEPSSADNNWNVQNGKQTDDGADHLHVDLGITLVATQYTEEEDSFDNTYDESAKYPIVTSGTLEPGATTGLTLEAGRVKVTVPAGSPAGSYKLDVNSLSLETINSDLTILNTDFAVTKDGQPTTGIDYEVELQTDIMAQSHVVTHKGEAVVFDYNLFTGIVAFTTDSFSPFAVSYDIFGYEVKVDAENERIFSGFFEDNINPVTIDATLLGDTSEYIAVDYVKDGQKWYSVSERATTIIVGDADDGGSGYTFENGNYPVTMINNNTLCVSAVSTLNKYDHGTLYILPGIYKEQRRLDVCGSMDIIGLGDAENIHLIKQGTTSTNSSHRHLINCSGGSDKPVTDHIQVTIRNLHLDATIGNGSNGRTDNGAVQSIRRSKVKCYDLIIDDNSTAAFYVNAKNAVDGVIYPAYMYVENCVVNVNSAGTVVDNRSAGKAYFQYNKLFYANGGKEYTSTSTYIKKQPLAWDDWDWEN